MIFLTFILNYNILLKILKKIKTQNGKWYHFPVFFFFFSFFLKEEKYYLIEDKVWFLQMGKD